MADNSSSSSNLSLLPPHFIFSNCFHSRAGNFIFTALTVTNTLLILPLTIVVLHLGHQQSRRQPSASTSPSNLIAYNMMVMEMMYISGSIAYCIGVYINVQRMMMVASDVFFITSCGQTSLHTLTCVVRYLAVVHPITYRRLRKGRIRIIIILCVWLLGLSKIGIIALNMFNFSVTLYFMELIFSLAVVSFCSLAILRVLKRPGPGEGGGDKERVNQSKLRALNTVMAIMGPLLLRFLAVLVSIVLYALPQMSLRDRCVGIESSFWFSLPSSLVLPLLFLHRAGKLTCCRTNTASGQRSS